MNKKWVDGLKQLKKSPWDFYFSEDESVVRFWNLELNYEFDVESQVFYDVLDTPNPPRVLNTLFWMYKDHKADFNKNIPKHLKKAIKQVGKEEE